MGKKKVEVGKQMSMFDDEKIIKTTINDAKAERLMNEIESGLIVDPVASTEDMLKLVYMDVFNKQWNKHNYVLRNINKARSSDRGLHGIRTSGHIMFDKTKDCFVVSDIKKLLDEYVEQCIHAMEYQLLREMWREFKFIVLFDPQQSFSEYTSIVRNMTESQFIKYINSCEPDYLKANVTINARNWELLPMTVDKYITLHYETPVLKVYEANTVGNISFSFDTNFIVNVLEAHSNVNTIEPEPEGLFTSICDEKRI